MEFELYQMLSSEQRELCDKIVQRATDRGLSVLPRAGFIGFGRKRGFYMFWIAKKEEKEPYFRCRITYNRGQSENIASFLLTAGNAEKIFAAMEDLYRDYEARRCIPAERDEPVERVFAYPWHQIAQHAFQVGVTCGADSENFLCLGADEFALCTDRVLTLLCEEMRNRRVEEIWRRYVLDDKATLRSVAEGCTFTHERVRQLVNKGSLTLEKMFLKHCQKGENEAFCACLEHMIPLLCEVGGALIPFLDEAFGSWGKRKREFVLRLLFGEENAEKLLELMASRHRLQARAPESPSRLKKDGGALSTKAGALLDAICYPMTGSVNPQEEIDPYPMGREYSHITRFRRKLEGMAEELRFVQCPDVVYYSTTQTDHRPDFLLEMPDGRRVLVLVLPTINMAFSYNLLRIAALQRFCRENGYGYLISDPVGRSFADLMKLELNPEFRAELNGILECKGRIEWLDIRELKKRYDVKNETVAAYVLQEGLAFTMQPFFWIRRNS